MVSVGIGLPLEFGGFDVAAKRRFVTRAAEAGLDHLFVADHVSFQGGWGMDGLVLAGALAMLEPTIGVHVGVYLLALRHPVPVARQIASIAEWAPGRLVLGVGVGGEDRHEFEVCGVDPATRGRRTDEALSVLRPLLRGERVTHRGEFFSFDDAVIKPVPDPPVSIVIGGRSDAALRRARQHGDGWLAVWVSPARIATSVETLGPGRHGLQVWVGVDGDRQVARERLAQSMEGFYKVPFSKFERYSPAGTPAEVADALRPYVDAGVATFNIQVVASGADEAIEGGAAIADALRHGC